MPFTFLPTSLPGVTIIEPRVFTDHRGFFLEAYKKSEFAAAGIDMDFVQDNHSRSVRGTLRGLHLQRAPRAQAKLVRAGKNGPEVTDGPFAEAKEFLAGYWIVDVDTPERAYAIAAEASASPGPGGKPMNMAIEVRQVMSGPPDV